MKKTTNNAGNRLFENKLGFIHQEVKDVKFSDRTNSILSGALDNDPIDPALQPNLHKWDERLKKIQDMGEKWDLMSKTDKEMWLKIN
jgi:hypothetical protein